MTKPNQALALSDATTNQIIGSMDSLFSGYMDKLAGIRLIADFVHGKDDLIGYFTNGSAHRSISEKLFDFDHAKAGLDAEFWSKAMDLTDVLNCMSATKRNEWSNDIHERKTPSFDRDTVITTIRNLLLSRGSFMADKVDGIFRKLSGNHVTNSPLGFKKRMIVSYVLDKFGYICHDRAEYLHDLRSVIAKLQNRDEPKTSNTQADLRRIASNEEFGEWHTFDGGAFRVRLYKVGTAHMEVHPSIAAKLNMILASLYPQAIAASARVATKREETIPLTNDILPYGVTQCLSGIADSLSRGKTEVYFPEIYSSRYDDIGEKTHYEVVRVLKFLGGEVSDDGVWKFPYDAAGVMIKVIRTGCLPEKTSHQYYPTPEALAERVVSILDWNEDDTILEPSAGQGAIADLLPKKQTFCVEVSDVNSAILIQKGFNTACADFMAFPVHAKFSKIIMNPPFSKGQAEAHVQKAATLMKDNARLVAILPASLRDKTIVKGMKHEWSEVIQGAFDDTGVSVVILELTN